MTKTSFNLDNRPEHFFETAQEALLWFCFCESTPKVRMQNHSDWSYCCEPSDVAIVVKKLLLQKKLTRTHIKILSKYGLKQMPPHENSGDSKGICFLWKQALEKLLEPFKLKGIVKFCGKAFAF